MREALGLIEIEGLSTAILVADAMAKTANISILGIENSKGLGYMLVKVSGDVGAVTAAINAGVSLATDTGKYVSSKVIPRPSIGVEKAFCTRKEETAKVAITESIPDATESLNNAEIAETPEATENSDMLEQEKEANIKKDYTNKKGGKKPKGNHAT